MEHPSHPVESHWRTSLRNRIIQASSLLEVLLSGLAKHSPGSSLEVLRYAIARHLVVGHDSAVENLLSVGAIALIFIVRKFFFVPAFGAHLPDGHPAPDLTPAQSGIPADWFRRRHSEAKPEEETETKE